MARTAYTPLVQEWQHELPERGEAKRPTLRCDRNLGARNTCVAALIVSWLIGGALTGLGVYVIHFLGPTYHLHYWEFYWDFYSFTDLYVASRALEGLKLLANIFLTFLIESLGYIHTASLRWTLFRQGRLAFSSNLRLCNSTGGFGPNTWYMNVIFTIATVLAYGSASLFFVIVSSGDIGTLSFCVVTGIFLGVSILVMALIATWSLFSTRVPTWSSSPLHITLAAIGEGGLEARPGRCMLGVQDINKESAPSPPKKKQIAALASRKAAASIVLMLIVIDVGLYVVSAVLLSQWLNETTNIPVGGPIPAHTGWDDEHMMIIVPDSLRSAHIYITIVLYATLLWPLTLCLHALELVVNLLRDAHCWRTAATRKGCALKRYDSIWAAFTNWRSVVLFVFKAIMHWVFGLTAIAYQPSSSDYSVSTAPNVLLSWRPWQSVVLAGVVNLCIVFFSLAGRYKLKGPQPAAYGHLQTLANLADEWSPTLYWGHKRDGPPCHAGTSDTPLDPIRMEALYA